MGNLLDMVMFNTQLKKMPIKPYKKPITQCLRTNIYQLPHLNLNKIEIQLTRNAMFISSKFLY